MSYLLRDGLIMQLPPDEPDLPRTPDLDRPVIFYALTERGRDFVRNLANADPLT